MSHPARMFDQALDAAQTLGQRPDPRPLDDVDRPLLGAGEERDHPPESGHLAGGDRMPGVPGQPGVEHVRDIAAAAQELDHGCGVLAVRAHAHRERLQPTQDEPGVERPGHRAQRVLEEAELLGQPVVGCGREAADEVGMAAQILGRRVHDQVGAELKRPLQRRRREGVVDHEDRPRRMCRVRRGRDVDHVQQRVGRGLDPDQCGPVGQPPAQPLVALGRRDVLEAVALWLEHP